MGQDSHEMKNYNLFFLRWNWTFNRDFLKKIQTRSEQDAQQRAQSTQDKIRIKSGQNLKSRQILDKQTQTGLLVHAVETDQPDMVIFFREKLGKLLQKHSDLTVPLQRFIDLSKEVEMKNTSKERREVCKVIINYVCTM